MDNCLTSKSIKGWPVNVSIQLGLCKELVVSVLPELGKNYNFSSRRIILGAQPINSTQVGRSTADLVAQDWDQPGVLSHFQKQGGV